MTVESTLKFLLLGEDKTAGKALRQVGGEAEATGGRFHGMATRTNVALLAVTGAAVAFGRSSVDAFKEVGTQTIQMQRIMGGTPQQASRMVFAAKESGVSFETLAKSTRLLEKNLFTASGSVKGNAAMVKLLGMNYKDAHGRILPTSVLMPKLADMFARMPAGTVKTAEAMKLFGKSGADMLPFLNKGAAGIKDLSKESDKFGLTLTGSNLDALKKSKASQREWNASLEGLRVQIGAQLLPMMNSMVGFIRDKVIPIVTAVTGFVRKHKTAVAAAAIVIGTIVVGFKAWAIATGILNAVMDANPIMLVVVAVAALAAGLVYAYKHSKTFREIVQAAFHAVGTAGKILWTILKETFKFIVDAFLAVAGAIVHGAASAFGWVPGVGPKLKRAAHSFDVFRADANRALGGVHNHVTVHADGLAATAAQIATFAATVRRLLEPIASSTVNVNVGGNALRGLLGRASGGSVVKGVPYIVGENRRPELFIPDSNGRIVPDVSSLANGNTKQGDVHITMNVTVNAPSAGQGHVIGRELAGYLEAYARSGGRMQIQRALT